MEPAAHHFPTASAQAMANPDLQKALRTLTTTLPDRRKACIETIPEFEALRDQAREIKRHTIAHLDYYLDTWSEAAEANDIQVHWCQTAEEARTVITRICQEAGAKTVTKGKSMISEEIGLNDHLSALNIQPVETDLGEYIVQIAGELPSHIIAPCIHKTKEQVIELFKAHHPNSRADEGHENVSVLVEEARDVLRSSYFQADVGITGANFLVAETGGMVLVTNEGNGDMTHTNARIHIALSGIEKVVPTREDVTTILRVLARSATGQHNTVYNSFVQGPRRAGDLDGPEEMHIVLLDNNRSSLLGSDQQDLLNCIRCGACLNHCPVYTRVGGHSYGWVYSGPIGAALTPVQLGIKASQHLPSASSLCGRCEEVCPMRIPLPKIFRHWRARAYAAASPVSMKKRSLKLWGFFARHPRLYQIVTNPVMRLLAMGAGSRRRFRYLPLARGWTNGRDLPAPEGQTFMTQYKKRGYKS